jgi:hypothetical protein
MHANTRRVPSYRSVIVTLIVALALVPVRGLARAPFAWSATPVVSTAKALGTNGGTSDAFNASGSDRGFLCVGHSGASPTISGSQTWDLVRTQDNGFSAFASLYRTADGSSFGASDTITATLTNGLIGIAATFFSGGATSAIDDQENSAGGVFGSSIQPGSITPTVNDTLIVTCAMVSDSQDTTSIDGSFVIADHVAGTASSFGVGIAYLRQTSAAAANPTWTFTSGATHQAATIASLKAASGGGAPPCRPGGMLLMGAGC